jgi:hypothetical protein
MIRYRDALKPALWALLFSLLGCGPIDADESAQDFEETEDDIVGGSAAGNRRGEVQIWIYGENKFVCTGILASKRWVVTAKHCISGVFSSTSKVAVFTGSFNLHQGTLHRVKSWKLHPSSDIALLQLQKDVTNLSPIGLSRSRPGVGTAVGISGWGSYKNVHSGPPSSKLKIASATVAGYGSDKIKLNKKGGTAGSGDSGGPVTLNNKALGTCSEGNDKTSWYVWFGTPSVSSWLKSSAGL